MYIKNSIINFLSNLIKRAKERNDYGEFFLARKKFTTDGEQMYIRESGAAGNLRTNGQLVVGVNWFTAFGQMRSRNTVQYPYTRSIYMACTLLTNYLPPRVTFVPRLATCVLLYSFPLRQGMLRRAKSAPSKVQFSSKPHTRSPNSRSAFPRSHHRGESLSTYVADPIEPKSYRSALVRFNRPSPFSCKRFCE